MKGKDAETDREKREIALTPENRADTDLLPIIDGELIDDSDVATKTVRSPGAARNLAGIKKTKTEITKTEAAPGNQSAAVRQYLLLPLIFLTVTLLGGLRLSESSKAFVFLKPELICLIFSAILLMLFFRAELIRIGGWFSEKFSTLKNLANAFVLFTLFTASVQLFNALLPERGLPFWIVGLLFFWTLWNNLFSVFTARRLVQSLGSLFGLAFVLKYLILANLTAPTGQSWLRSLIENPGREIFTYLLDLPRYAAGTGYIQFFTVIFYVVGLFLLAPDLGEDGKRRRSSAGREILETDDER